MINFIKVNRLNIRHHLVLLAVSLWLITLNHGPVVSADDGSTNDEVNLQSDQIARLRNFEVENLYVTSKDGYIINVVFIPAVNKTANKRPVVFNHGSTQSSTYFMFNSVGARPKDYSNLDASSMSKQEIENLLLNDPVSKCMPLLLACFGHDVYLINRRGTETSLGRVGSTGGLFSNLMGGFGDRLDGISNSIQSSGTEIMRQIGGTQDASSGLLGFLGLFVKPQINLASLANTLDMSYWKFSLDEQAIYDLPACLELAMKKSNSPKVAYVGHSLGNGVMFMLQSEQPEWGDRVEPFLAWSPDFYLGHSTSVDVLLFLGLQPILTPINVPFPPTPIDPLTRTLLASLCQTEAAQATICRLLENAMWGFSGDQQETKPAFVASQFYTVSGHEIVQLAQNFEKGKMYKFDFGPVGNLATYGSLTAPLYDVSKITSKSISLWHGAKDALATPTDVNLIKSDMRVPVDDRFITETPFNHYDLLFGRNVSNLVNLPSLQLIESYK